MTISQQRHSHSLGWLLTLWSLLPAVLALLLLISISSASEEELGTWHRIRKGETLWRIANQYQVSVESILDANQIQSARRLLVGEELFIPGVVPSSDIDGDWYTIQKGDTLWKLSQKYNVTVKTLMYVNKLKSATRLRVGAEILIPNPEAVGFNPPMRIPLIVTSGYGYRWHPISRKRSFHHGVDLRAQPGTRVYAAKLGRVIRAERYGGYGNVVVIQHLGEYTTWYGHLSKIWVKAGQTVRRGQAIGLSGSSGYATGPHLHYELRWKNKSVDASRYIPVP
jgi:murein DD-endopeptidase MepM/ murein hydrolase activator NlpD